MDSNWVSRLETGKGNETKVRANLSECTGKSFSEALILELVNPKYCKRLFIEFSEKYKFTTCCVLILFLMLTLSGA